MPAQIPPWLQPASPADYWTKGVQLGLQVASQRQQAAQAAASAARQQQAQAVAEARDVAEFGLQQQAQDEKAKAAAARLAAMQSYQSEVAAGANPIQAMLKYGTAMGNEGGASAAIHAQLQQREQADKMALAQQAMAGRQKHYDALEGMREAELKRKRMADEDSANQEADRQAQIEARNAELERHHKALETRSTARVTIEDANGNKIVGSPDDAKIQEIMQAQERDKALKAARAAEDAIPWWEKLGGKSPTASATNAPAGKAASKLKVLQIIKAGASPAAASAAEPPSHDEDEEPVPKRKDDDEEEGVLPPDQQ